MPVSGPEIWQSPVKLSFPNPSRSFDANNRRVRFWGYDSAMEVGFFVEADALKQLCPEMSDTEAGFLQAFDSARDQICQVACDIYGRGGTSPHAYILTAEDFGG